MAMRKMKGISYDPIKDADVIEFLDKQPNASRYVLELVRKDMYQSKETNIEALVRKIIQEHYSNDNKGNGKGVDVSSIKSILDI